MKRILLHFILIFTFIKSGYSQVSNDNCQNAISLDTIFYGFPNFNCYNFIPVDTAINTSNTNALVDFPYPAFPLPCNGYTSVPAVPANDIWYKIECVAGWDLNILSSCTDTTHIVFWFGDSCSYLAHAACITLLPGDTTFFVPGNTFSKTYIQLSGNGVNQFTTINLCFYSGPPGVPVYYSGLPTPYICMDYNKTSTDASSSTSNNGSISINILAGNPPYQIQWNDGGTGFQRSNLAPGQYIFTITDSVGCITTDTITINVSTGITAPRKENCFYGLENITSPQTIEIFLSKSESSTFYLINTLGEIVCDNKNYKGRLSNLPQGIYFLRYSNDSDDCLGKFYLINPN
jgi:hypothetical protein